MLKPDSQPLVATEGHRLARLAVKAEIGITQELGVSLPKKTLLERGQLLATNQHDLWLNASNVGASLGSER